MKKKEFALVCLNEDSTVVSVSVHSTKEKAFKKMEKEYNSTKEEYDDYPIESSDIDDERAEVIISDSNAYYWQIVETE